MEAGKGRQERRDAGQEGVRAGEMKEIRTEERQDKREAGQKGDRTRGRQQGGGQQERSTI